MEHLLEKTLILGFIIILQADMIRWTNIIILLNANIV